MPGTALHRLRRALDKFRAPVPWMLEAAVIFELALGKYVEAAIVAASAPRPERLQALAKSDGGQYPVDAAIRGAAEEKPTAALTRVFGDMQSHRQSIRSSWLLPVGRHVPYLCAS